ncbi:MAG: glycosyl hydrolase family 18 protein, partial [Chloroflexota bacterium]|nr:glycosyl hydrolase family 18 protein [Chloroflexota bacterium]
MTSRPNLFLRYAALALATIVVVTGCGAGSVVVAVGEPAPASPLPTASPLPAASPAPPALAATPPPPAPPAAIDVPYDPTKFGFQAKGMSGEMMVFMPIGQIGYALDKMDWGVVSTLVFFSLEAGRNGQILNDGGWRAWNSTRMDALIEKAHANGTKIVMSLERFAWSPGQTAVSRALLGSPAARERLARDVAAEVVRRGVDGVNVDFEPIPRGLKAEFTLFVRSLRAALDSYRAGYQLTFDVVGHYGSYDVASLVGPDAADAVYLMGYHYSGTFSRISGSTAPMGGARYDVVDTVRGLRKLVAAHEIIVGAPFYGHMWPTAGSAINSRVLGGGSDVIYSKAVAIARRYGIRYDKVQQVAWVRYRARACARCPLR